MSAAAKTESARVSPKVIFVVLNVIGGVAVLGSYAWGLLNYPQHAGALWGGVPEARRGIYTANMFFAAAGYLTVFAHLLRGVPSDFRLGRVGYGFVTLAFAVILLFSSLWMPVTLVVIDARAGAATPLIFVILTAVSLGTVAVGWLLWRLPASRLGWAARIGWLFFGLQTVVLDGIIWSLLFELPA